VRLTDTTWPDVGSPVLCVPIGSCEQHGPHLPLGTDTIVAEALAEALADRRPGIVVGPSLGITASGEHAGFPGTLSIGTAALTAVVVELVRSAGWANGVVLVNGHGGNRDAVDRAVATLAGERRRVLSWWPRHHGDAHAGHTETSLLLHVRPDLVRGALAEVGITAPLTELSPRLRAEGVRAVAANGVLGDPTGATEEDGRAIFAAFVEDLLAAYDAWSGPTA
jgi:creatinine amidohydrolase